MQETSATWKALWTAGAALEARAVIAGTAYTEISAPVIVRAAMSDALSIGNVAAASLSLVIRGAGSIPRSAEVVIETRLSDGVTASEWLPQGTFYISRRARDPVTGALALECYDGLLKANAIWTPSAGSWPRTMGQVLSELAGLLGLALDSRTVVPSGIAFMLSEPEAGTTIRDALGMIAQAGGGSFVVTPGNKLRLVPLADVSGAAGATGDAVDVDGVTGGIEVGGAATVTGLRDSWAGTTTLTGDDTGIVVDVALAPMVAVEVAGALIGRRYQPYSLTGAVCDPAAELGDFVRAGANGEVASALYSQRLTLGPAPRCELAAPGGGEVTDEYPYIGAATKTLALAKAYAREIAADAVAGLDDALTQREIFNRLTDDGAAQGLVLYNGQLYVNASYINAGALNARFINFNAPVDDFSVPDENDPDSLLEGQRVVNGWIVNISGSGGITALECDYAKLLRGRTVTLTFAYNGDLDYCEAFWASFEGDEGSKVTQPVSPPNPYTYAFTVPDDAEWFSIAFTCSGIRQIRASVSGSAIVYPDDIRFTYAGLEVGRFTVDRSGNVRAGGWNLFRGATRFIGKVDMDSPLLIGSGGTGARSAAGARTNLDVPSRTGAGASGTWGINVSGSAGSVAWGDVSGKPANYPGGCTGAAGSVTWGNVSGKPANYPGGCTGHANSDLALSGGTLTGKITFNKVKNAIAYTGTKATYDMIKFIDNTGDEYGNGIYIGGGGAAIIGGGESADVAAGQVSGGSEILYLCNDGDVNVFTNMQSGWGSRKTFTFGANGTLTAPAFSGPLTGNASNVTGTVAVGHGGTGATTAANARANLGLNDIGTTEAITSYKNLNNQNQQVTINITKDCWVCASFHVTANTDGICILSRNGIPVINNVHTNGACNYWANAQFPVKAGGLLQYKLSSNASDSYISFLTV